MDEADDAIQTNTSFVVGVAIFVALSWLLARAVASRSAGGENQEGGALGYWWWRGAGDEDTVMAFFFLLALFYLIVYMEASWMSLMPVLVLLSLVFNHHYGASFWTLDRVVWCCWSLSQVLLLCYRKQILSWLSEPICKSLPKLFEELKKPENCLLVASLVFSVGSMWYRGVNPITRAMAVRQMWRENREAREVQRGPFLQDNSISNFTHWLVVVIRGMATVSPGRLRRRAAGARAPASAQSVPSPASASAGATPAPAPAPSSPTTGFAERAGGPWTPDRRAMWTPPRRAMSSS